MKLLQFFRSKADGRASQPSTTRDGLDAFASEQPPDAASDTAAADNLSRLKLMVGALAVLVVIEAIPAALWLTDRFGVASGSELDAAAPPPAAAAATLIAAAPCEPTPAVTTAPAPASPPPPRASTASSAAAAPTLLAGMIAVSAPVPMLVYEAGRVVGTSEAPSLMLRAGAHDLEFVNESVGYRVRRQLQVQAGQTTTVRLDPPLGTLHVNAIPWAEVWIDDERVGETPIGNHPTRIGNHQVVFRHPELGERRATVMVTLTGAARISMDMRNK